MNTEISNYINQAPEEQKQAMIKIRSMLHDLVPNLSESFKWSRPVFGAASDFLYFKTSKNHLTVGFSNIKKIENDIHLLEGTGKDMRHIKVKKSSDLDIDLLKKWILATSTK
jgi:uncharacterized protein YdhG (YjbR/CyaY superfamily)